ncbi:23S rRNA (uracil(1939)-C(5))-methyltransferase RlmD [Shewanella sp. NIFS-20-20]|uniref:23S rRNA (uracil(1939)-C(5))-methyltransferase RlmD n=1 Tax=Shewanella sp. NIFS-20-20 TaxID=2853806 RepID=UPI001C467CBD|nr:23S rRNA (uracil(1939)-C(5))-methyltransferase RlmD [Shewanella sp. NIFS-20-20]MBV7316731.1 23S rRNA (uracil(1939)-C(5))-methyltransferase RlmD [Shewanella sp. NIFS-20-20]
MAQFFKPKANLQKRLSPKLVLQVTDMDHLGAGMAQHNGKVVFIAGALPTEQVTAQLTEQKKSYAKAKLISVDSASALRISPECEFYQQCGGCDLQHVAIATQRQFKQDALANRMGRISEAVPLVATIESQPWHYRRRARLATAFDKHSGKLSLGFRAKASNQVIAVSHCKVLALPLSELIAPLHQLLNRLKLKAALGHVELIIVENGQFVVLRVTKAVNEKDRAALQAFANTHQVQVLLQDNQGLCLDVHGQASLPYYTLQDGCQLQFTPGNFIQVNPEVNHGMIAQALAWLDPQTNDRILDLFCGVGNFSVALAKTGAQVIGVEGVPAMVEQAKANAKAAGLDNLAFYHGDLSADLTYEPWLGQIDKLLLDPARAGAYESLQWLHQMQPKKVVYVSCDPASLARDSQLLLDNGYRLVQVGMLDMFPQTHHIEAMVLFELK